VELRIRLFTLRTRALYRIFLSYKEINELEKYMTELPVEESRARPVEELKIILEEYKFVVQTQMHFNEMINRMRTTAISVFLVIISFSVFSLQYNLTMKLNNYIFHASILIVLMSLIFLLSIMIIDLYYYNVVMLRYASRASRRDKQFKEYKNLNFSFPGQNILISEEINERKASRKIIILFYALPFMIGLIFLILLILGWVVNTGG